ncbi:MAG: DUF4298 domain-containing protein [Gallicola sp.]|nr:DUF4298 domain-containing protein [Gallicola sp.]
MDTAKERMIKAEEMYDKVAGDNEKLREIIERLKEMPENMEPLSDYYFNQWMEDLNELESAGFENKVTNQDAIYEEIIDQYDMMKEIILIGAKYINQNFN